MKTIFVYSSMVLAVLLGGCQEGACCNQDLSIVENKIDKKENITPIANFENLVIKKDGGSCTFSGDGSISSDEDGEVTGYRWSIDNSEVSQIVNPTDISVACPSNIETPIVCLTVTDDEGADSLKKCREVEVTVVDPKPTPEPTGQPTPKPDPEPTDKEEPKKNINPNCSQDESLWPTPVIEVEEIEDGKAFMFSCINSYDNDDIDSDNNPEYDPRVVECFWDVIKEDKNGSNRREHNRTAMSKWIGNDKYELLHITLTVTDDDNCTSSETKTYEKKDK